MMKICIMLFTGRTSANPENLIPNSNESTNINLENISSWKS